MNKLLNLILDLIDEKNMVLDNIRNEIKIGNKSNSESMGVIKDLLIEINTMRMLAELAESIIDKEEAIDKRNAFFKDCDGIIEWD